MLGMNLGKSAVAGAWIGVFPRGDQADLLIPRVMFCVRAQTNRATRASSLGGFFWQS
jgi:hypothetical protein